MRHPVPVGYIMTLMVNSPYRKPWWGYISIPNLNSPCIIDSRYCLDICHTEFSRPNIGTMHRLTFLLTWLMFPLSLIPWHNSCFLSMHIMQYLTSIHWTVKFVTTRSHKDSAQWDICSAFSDHYGIWQVLVIFQWYNNLYRSVHRRNWLEFYMQ